MALIFLFVDGVGLAPAGPDNPLTDAPTPALHALLGGPLTSERLGTTSSSTPVLLRAIDATLGVAGLPQSGTGQTALLGGFNAAALHGRHQPHFPPVALRALLAEQSIFRRVTLAGGRVAFANAFGAGYWQALAARRIRRSASVIAAEGAGVRFRDDEDVCAGRAVAWDVTGATIRAAGVDAPFVSAHDAGARLARLTTEHELVFFETFLPDLAGHGRLEARREPQRHKDAKAQRMDEIDGVGDRRVAQIHVALGLVDGLIGGVLAALRPADTLLLTSDHGNVESLDAPAHTPNPVPLLAVGPQAAAFEHVADIAQVAEAAVRVALDGARAS